MTTTSTAVRYHGPADLRTRGRILVVPGRGESQATYVRLATRLAADSYQVPALAPPVIDRAGPDGAVARLARTLAGGAEPGGGAGGRPLVLIGADPGALAVAAVLAQGALPAQPPPPDAVVLAG